MTFPITYEARQDGELRLLVVASEKGKFTVYRSSGSIRTEEDSPASKNIFDDPKIGFGYMGIGNHQSEGIDEPKITEGASAKLIDSLVKEMKKSSK